MFKYCCKDMTFAETDTCRGWLVLFFFQGLRARRRSDGTSVGKWETHPGVGTCEAVVTDPKTAELYSGETIIKCQTKCQIQ